jgi:antitoxin YobK
MNAYEEAAASLRANPRSYFVGPRDLSVVATAEKRLGVRFPPSYRRFLLEFGCGNVGSQEIYGLIDQDVERGPIPNAAWLNLERRARGWRPTLFVIYESGDGTSHALDLDRLDSEGEASAWLLDVAGNPTEQVATDFGDFLRSLTH